MALISVALTKSTFKDTHPDIKGYILPYNTTEEKTARKIIRKFLKKYVGDKLLVFADKRSDKLGNLIVLKDECEKANIELDISLYCKNTDSNDEKFGQMMFREIDLKMSEELSGMSVW